MLNIHAPFRAYVAVLTIVTLLSSPIAPIMAQAPAASRQTGAAATAPPVDPDGGWPRSYTTASGSALILYQPQIASWNDQKHAQSCTLQCPTARRARKSPPSERSKWNPKRAWQWTSGS